MNDSRPETKPSGHPSMKPGTHTPLIVSGAPRSGTSLLYNLFDGHPEVA